jgi:flagellar biosynthetic protein FlhB
VARAALERTVSDGDKRFDATASRRARAKREGNVPQSTELCSMAAFGAATLVTMLAVPLGATAVAVALHETTAGLSVIAGESFVQRTAHAFGLVAVAALLPIGAAAIAGATTSLLQRGGLRVTGVKLELTRLDPTAGVRRMAGGETLVAVARAAIGFAAALLAIVPSLREAVAGGTALSSPAAAAGLVGSAALRACVAAFAAGATFAVADYALARRRWLRGLRMSLHELRRDAKENEGDPQARARRKGTHRAIVRGAIGRTREASFVVVNPEHVAVALRYAPPDVAVPEILVRALDDAALRVRTIAREHAIPIVEDAALARLLYGQGENGRAIPPDAYVAVALVIAALAREGAMAAE